MKKTTLSDILKILMFKKDIKTSQLARALKLPQQTLQRIVAGASPNPHLSSLQPIAEYFAISLAQLRGEEPLANTFLTDLPINNSKIKNIPIIEWRDINSSFNINNFPVSDNMFVSQELGDNCFSVIMNDMSMEPYFPQGSILIFDPNKKINDRSFVLAVTKETETAIFRQILIDGEHRYLKPLNPDLNIFSMRLLNKNDTIVAGLVEFRHIYKDL